MSEESVEERLAEILALDDADLVYPVIGYDELGYFVRPSDSKCLLGERRGLSSSDVAYVVTYHWPKEYVRHLFFHGGKMMGMAYGEALSMKVWLAVFKSLKERHE